MHTTGAASRCVRRSPGKTSSTPEQLAKLLKERYDRWGPIVKKIGFTADS